MAVNQGIMFTAAPVSALLAYWLVPTTLWGLDGWRWVVLFGSAGAILVWFIRLGLPESPRWLVQKGKLIEAEAIVLALEAKVKAAYGRPLPPPHAPVKPPTAVEFRMRQLWRPPYLSRILMLSVFHFCQAIGNFGFANWVPSLLVGQGITVTKSLLYSFVIAIALPAGAILAIFYADRVQRKWIIVGAAAGSILFGSLFAQMREPEPLIVLGILITICSVTLAVGFHSYQNELFPTPVRAAASGLVYSVSRIGGLFSGFIIAFLLRDFGVVGVFAGISACMLTIILIIGVFGPKTTGMRLEEISQ